MYKNLFNDKDLNIVSWNMYMGCHLFKNISDAFRCQKYNSHKTFFEAYELANLSNMEFQEVHFQSNGLMLIEREMCDCFGRCLGYDDLYVEFCPELNSH